MKRILSCVIILKGTWSVDGVEVSQDLEKYVFTPTTSGKYKVEFRAINNGPEGDEWYDISNDFNITVYDAPEVIAPERLSTYSGKEFKIELEKNNGAEDWMLFWWKNKEISQNELGEPQGDVEEWRDSFSILDTIENTSDTKDAATYHVVWANIPSGSIFPLKVDSVNIVVDVYPKADVEVAQNKKSAIAGYTKDISLTATATGGFDGDGAWTYVWKKNNQVIQGENSPVLKFNADAVAGFARTDVYEVMATNKYGDETWDVVSDRAELTLYPNVEFDTSAKAVACLGGKSFVLEANPIGGAPNGETTGWTYQWSVDGVELQSANGNKYETTAQEGQNHVYKVKVSNYDGEELLYSAEKEFRLTVYKAPTATQQSDSSLKACSGQNVELSIEADGGYPNGWEYEWYRNGVRLSDHSSSLRTEIKNNLKNGSEKVNYSVIVRNSYENELWYNRTFDFVVQAYGEPTLNVVKNYDAYIGTVISPVRDFVTSLVGGFDDEGVNGGWELTVTDSSGAAVSNDLAINESGSYLVRALNKTPEDDVWYDETYSVNVQAFDRGSIGLLETDSLDVYAGGMVRLNLPVKGGYPDGWVYEWKSGDNLIATTSDPSCEVLAENLSVATQQTFTVHAVNSLRGETGCDETTDIVISLWPKAVFGDLDYPTAAREGNKIRLSVEPARNGYLPNGWTYVWSQGGQIRPGAGNSLTDEPVVNFSGLGKGTVDVHYALSLTNYGPSGSIWDAKTYDDIIVTIYRRPQTPTSLVKKGSGASGTMITTCNLSDADLEGHDYYLVFGYRDGAGAYHDMTSLRQTNPGEVRWSTQIPSAVLNDAGNLPYVYALWKYSNGVEITSGLRTLNGVDENWDDSSYSGRTRAVIEDVSGIQEITRGNIADGATYLMNGQRVNRRDGRIVIRRDADGSVFKMFNK